MNHIMIFVFVETMRRDSLKVRHSISQCTQRAVSQRAVKRIYYLSDRVSLHSCGPWGGLRAGSVGKKRQESAERMRSKSTEVLTTTLQHAGFFGGPGDRICKGQTKDVR